MIRSRLRLRLCVGFTVALLSACGNPYALKVNSIAYDKAPTSGSIQVTDAKLYRREALINERRDEVSYIQTLLTESKTQYFPPAVTRELQSIVTLSASLGLKVDPAAGLNYRRERETSDIQQEMATLKLQLQLDQLKRDAELMRQKLAAQETQVNDNLGKAGDGSGKVTAPTPGGAADPSLKELIASIDSLKTALSTGFGKNFDPLTPLGSAAASRSDPIDTFNDRAAYRNLLNSARNAASLDELHDRDGAALVRLNLTATVFPPGKDYLSTLGLLRMSVVAPNFDTDKDKDALPDLYRDWLSHINADLNVAKKVVITGAPDNVTFQMSPTGAALSARGDLFDTIDFEYSDNKAVTGCQGANYKSKPTPKCKHLAIAAPRAEAYKPLTPTSELQPPSSMQMMIIDASRSVDGESAFRRMLINTRQGVRQFPGSLSKAGSDSNSACLPSLTKSVNLPGSGEIPFETAVNAARNTVFVFEALVSIQAKALATLTPEQIVNPDYAPINPSIVDAAREANALIGDLNDTARTVGCVNPFADRAKFYVPELFRRAIGRTPRLAVYQVGPRNQAQTVSTVARASEAIALAASISGQIPSSGLSGDGNIAYGRSVTGKADALERVPLVIAFAEAAEEDKLPSFGWLMGPRTSLDARKKELLLEQVLTTHDLTVDLSVPGWWPFLYLDTETAWAPKWPGGAIRGMGRPHTIKVALAPSAADFDNLTGFLIDLGSLRIPAVTSVSPATISACATDITVQIIGRDLWRATEVVIGGKLFTGDNVKVLPDMRGLRVTVAKSEFPSLTGDEAVITVLTPYGPAIYPLKITKAKPDGTCDAPAKAAGTI